MKASDNIYIKSGGLYRCCIQTLHETEVDRKPSDGDIIQCVHCGAKMMVHKGFWQWLPDDE